MAQAYCGSRGNNAIKRPSGVILWLSSIARSIQSVFSAEATAYIQNTRRNKLKKVAYLILGLVCPTSQVLRGLVYCISY